MKTQFQIWLNRIAKTPGILAGGIQFRDRSSITSRLPAPVPETSIERSIRCAVETFQVLNLHRTRARSLRFVYPEGCVYASQRPDQICLALLTRHDRQATDPSEINRLLQEFLHMGLKGN